MTLIPRESKCFTDTNEFLFPKQHYEVEMRSHIYIFTKKMHFHKMHTQRKFHTIKWRTEVKIKVKKIKIPSAQFEMPMT